MKLAKLRDNLLFWPLFIPLIFTPFTFQPWHFGKTILFVILIDVICVLSLIDYFKKDKLEIKFSKFDLTITLLMVIFFIASLFAFDVERAFFGTMPRADGFLIIFHFYLYYLLLRQFFGREHWLTALRLTVVIALISEVIAWIGPSIDALHEVVVGNYTRLNGMLGNTIFFASYLWVVLIMLGLAFFADVAKKWKWLYLFTILTTIVTIVGTGTRGAVLAIFAALVGFGVLYLFIIVNSRKIKIAGAVILVAFALFISYLYLPAGVNLRNNLPENLQPIFNVATDSRGAGTRLMAWQIAWQGFLDRPLVGWGASNFQYAFDKFYNPNLLLYGTNETVWDIPHNEALQILVSIGLFGFIFFIYLVSLTIYKIWKVGSQNPTNKFKFVFLISTIIGYVTQAMFAAETSNSLVYLYFGLAFIIGLTDANSKIFAYSKTKKYLSVVVLIALIINVFWGAKSLEMSNYLIKARNYAEASDLQPWQTFALRTLNTKSPYTWEAGIHLGSDLIKFRDISRSSVDLTAATDEIIQTLDNKNKKIASNYWINFWLAQIYGNKGEYIDKENFNQAYDYLGRASLPNINRQSIDFLKARYLLVEGRTDEAESSLRSVIDKNPQIAESHWLLGAVLAYKGETQGAVAEFETSIALGYGYESVVNITYLIDLYAELKDYNKIVPLYERLIRIEPTKARWYASLAATYAELGNNDKVIEYMSKAIDLDPSLIPEAKEFLKLNNIEL